MTTYVNPLTGQTIQPSAVGYESLTLTTSVSLEWPVNGNTTNVVASIMDVNATTSGLTITMPSATQVSDGQDVLIRNTGVASFTVLDYSGGTICVVPTGVVKYIYITNNTTDAGTWAVFTFGTGSSSADAATLAGYGLTAIGTTLNQSYDYVGIYSAYGITSADRAAFLVWEGGAGTMTLPSAAAVGANWFTIIRNNGTGILTVSPAGTDTIDGNASAQLQIDESFVIVSNGSGWNTFGYGQSAQFFFTQLAKVVTGGTVTLTAAEASNIIQEYSGALTSNCDVILPPTVQIYSLQNNTTGSYTLTFSTGAVGATTVAVPQGKTYLVICDGTNVYSTQTPPPGTSSNLTLGPGSAATPALNFLGNLSTGLYLPATNQIGLSINGTNSFTLSSSGLQVPVGISGGVF